MVNAPIFAFGCGLYQYIPNVLEIKFPFSATIMETTAEPSVSTSLPPITLPPSVTSWSLDLDVGVLILEVYNSEGLNVLTANCSAFQMLQIAVGLSADLLLFCQVAL